MARIDGSRGVLFMIRDNRTIARESKDNKIIFRNYFIFGLRYQDGTRKKEYFKNMVSLIF